MILQRIERAIRGDQSRDGATAVGTVRQALGNLRAGTMECVGQRTERGRQDRLQPLPQRRRQPGRSAARADRADHRIAIDDGGKREIAKLGPIGDVDQQPPRLEPRRDGLDTLLQRDEADPCVIRFFDDPRARPVEQAPPRIGDGTGADQDHGLALQAQKQGKAVHPAFSRAAAALPSGARHPYDAAMRIVPLAAAITVALPLPLLAQAMPGMDMSTPAPNPDPTHDHAATAGAAPMKMTDSGVLTGSGTSRLPAAAAMTGLHLMPGDWTLMVHGYAWGAFTHASGPRGDDEAYVQSMAMVEATHDLDPATRFQLRAMLSLDPLMGERGYPSLLATGESAHGQPLVDRQHPHDLFMELSGRVDRDIGPGALFVYGGLPGEPALGPGAFMHRPSARFLTQAPIGHHWFDSTHISFGVLTAGYGTKSWQIESSLFNGREPDEHRWDIETGRLDSWSIRGTVNPSDHWSAEISYGRLKHPERLHPEDDESRLIASVAYAGGGLDLTAGFSAKKREPGRTLDAWFGEATYAFSPRHALFGRAESLRNDELFEDDPLSPLADRPFRVERFTAGYAYSLPIGSWASMALGGEGSVIAKPAELRAAYGKTPLSLTVFAKLILGQ